MSFLSTLWWGVFLCPQTWQPCWRARPGTKRLFSLLSLLLSPPLCKWA